MSGELYFRMVILALPILLLVGVYIINRYYKRGGRLAPWGRGKATDSEDPYRSIWKREGFIASAPGMKWGGSKCDVVLTENGLLIMGRSRGARRTQLFSSESVDEELLYKSEEDMALTTGGKFIPWESIRSVEFRLPKKIIVGTEHGEELITGPEKWVSYLSRKLRGHFLTSRLTGIPKSHGFSTSIGDVSPGEGTGEMPPIGDLLREAGLPERVVNRIIEKRGLVKIYQDVATAERTRIRCPSCGQIVDGKLQRCPHCGYNLEEVKREMDEFLKFAMEKIKKGEGRRITISETRRGWRWGRDLPEENYKYYK